MPEIGRIQSTNFQSLLTELGITRNQIPFGLQSEVMPVVLVGGTVSFVAPPTPPYTILDIFTAGEQIAPAAGTVLADTGPLPLGAYFIYAIASAGENARLDFEWRDAANALNLRLLRFFTNQDTVILEFRANIETDNERFRIVTPAAGSATIGYNGQILAKL